MVFNHRCLPGFACVFWDHRVNNSDFRHGVPGKQGESIDEVVSESLSSKVVRTCVINTQPPPTSTYDVV